MRCVELDDWKSLTSSLTVIDDLQGSAVGYWSSWTQTESINMKLHYGIDMSVSQEDVDTQSYEFDLSMSEGFSFLGMSSSMSINQKYSQTISNDTKRTYSANFSVDVPKTCTVKEGTEGVGLYQWYVATDHYSNVIRSTHSICRYGDMAFKMPECPFPACIDAECLSCADDWQA